LSNAQEILGVVYHPDYLIHTNHQHPERKERLEHIWNVLEADSVKGGYELINPEPADVETIALVHETSYIESIQKACKQNLSFLDMDTYIVPESYDIALLSAGGAVKGLDEIMQGNYKKVFGLNRPPGHHAEDNQAMGFCIFNNIAITARVAQQKYDFQRIAIVDWDVHHGNGTQHTFTADNNVLFFSVHQSPAFPGTGNLREVGHGAGEGYTINVPLPAGCGDDDYLKVFDEVLLPVLDEFEPQLILLSAGQDAYHKDPLAGMNLTKRGYFQMAQKLREIADRHAEGRILVCLEGGYHLEGQAGAVLQAMNALGNWNLPVPAETAENYSGEMAERRIREVKEIHSNIWTSLK